MKFSKRDKELIEKGERLKRLRLKEQTTIANHIKSIED
jgi:hypothetical protein